MHRLRSAPGFKIDLHVHTVLGSIDSSLEPDQLTEAMRRSGMDAVLLTEHQRVCPPAELAALAPQAPDRLFGATEWSTDLGHVLVLGLDRRPSGLYRAHELRERVLREGGFMIAAHPFRYYFQPWHFGLGSAHEDRRTRSIEEAALLPLLRYVDAVESLNGNSLDAENALAAAVAERLGLPQTGGSDAHAAQTLGSCYTVLDERPEDLIDIIRQLRDGRCQPAANSTP